MATSIDDRPSTGERYSIATESSNLKVKEGRCDADFLIAAGWSGDRLGIALYRLAKEASTLRSRIPMPEQDATVNKLWVVENLRGLATVKEALNRFGVMAATRMGLMTVNDRAVAAVVGRVLSVWLDPHCRPCNGTGKTGVYGSAMNNCRACGGSTKRDHQVGQTDEERVLAKFLLSEMDRKASAAEHAMRRLLRENQGV